MPDFVSPRGEDVGPNWRLALHQPIATAVIERDNEAAGEAVSAHPPRDSRTRSNGSRLPSSGRLVLFVVNRVTDRCSSPSAWRAMSSSPVASRVLVDGGDPGLLLVQRQEILVA
jgi:hypothetical protein